MSTSLTPLTELGAVNIILGTIGATAINSLDGAVPIDASTALGVLNEVSYSMQITGWYWNREVFLLSTDANGRIPLPENTLEVKAVDRSRSVTKRERAGVAYLYDLSPYTSGFSFDAPVRVETTLELPYNDLPASAKIYVTLKAARLFAGRSDADEVKTQSASEEEQKAWSALVAEDNANSHRNLQQSLSVSDITMRGFDVFYNNRGLSYGGS